MTADRIVHRNWAGNVRFRAAGFHRPATIPELQHLVSRSSRVRVLGTGHSFSPLADTTGELVSLAGLPTTIDIDTAAPAVRVGAATSHAELGAVLDRHGLAIANLGSLTQISVAGATVTATHGSGSRQGNLATLVTAVDVVTAGGDLVSLSRAEHGERFDGMVVTLGLLGAMTTLTLNLVPSFHVRQDVFEALTHDDLLEHVDHIVESGYSVSVFSTWRRPRRHAIFRKRITTPDDVSPAEPSVYSATLAPVPRHPLGPGWPADNVTEQLGVSGPWHERLPHFRADATPSFGSELQSEYVLDRAHIVAALTALDDIADRIAAVLQVSELRTVAADELWLSPNYRRDSACLHFTWVDDLAAVLPVVAAIEHRLAALGIRPHWGKIFTMDRGQLAEVYPRMPDFQALVADLDPRGVFGNELTDRLITGG